MKIVKVTLFRENRYTYMQEGLLWNYYWVATSSNGVDVLVSHAYASKSNSKRAAKKLFPQAKIVEQT